MTIWEVFYYVQKVTLKTIPEGVQVCWIVSANAWSSWKYLATIGFTWIWHRPVVSGVWMQLWQYIQKHYAMQVHTQRLVLQCCHGLAIWWYYNNFLFKTCFLPYQKQREWHFTTNIKSECQIGKQCIRLKYVYFFHTYSS
jgi:hypothetical protein